MALPRPLLTLAAFELAGCAGTQMPEVQAPVAQEWQASLGVIAAEDTAVKCAHALALEGGDGGRVTYASGEGSGYGLTLTPDLALKLDFDLEGDPFGRAADATPIARQLTVCERTDGTAEPINTDTGFCWQYMIMAPGVLRAVVTPDGEAAYDLRDVYACKPGRCKDGTRAPLWIRVPSEALNEEDQIPASLNLDFLQDYAGGQYPGHLGELIATEACQSVLE